MKEPTPPEIAKIVGAKAEELIAEFVAYRDEIDHENPDDPNPAGDRIAFEGWAIQKIAGLHCVMLDLERVLKMAKS